MLYIMRYFFIWRKKETGIYQNDIRLFNPERDNVIKRFAI